MKIFLTLLVIFMLSISLFSQNDNIEEAENEFMQEEKVENAQNVDAKLQKKNVLDMTDEEYEEYRKQKKAMQKKNEREASVLPISAPSEEEAEPIYANDYGIYGELEGGIVPYQGGTAIEQGVGDALKVIYVTKLSDGNLRVTYDTVNNQRRVQVLTPVQYNFLLRDCQINAQNLKEQDQMRRQIKQAEKEYNRSVEQDEKKIRKAEKKAEKEYYENRADFYRYMRKSTKYDMDTKKYFRDLERKAKKKAKGK